MSGERRSAGRARDATRFRGREGVSGPFRAAAGAVAAALLCFAAPAEAQFFGPLERLFERVDGLTIYGTVGGLVSSDQVGTDGFLGVNALRGMGVEVLIDISRRPTEATEAEPPDGNAGGTDAAEREAEPPAAPPWGIELGLGVDYLTGFAARDPSLDLRGSLRGLPNLSAYATPPVRWGTFQPYFGLGIGFAQLWNVQGYDPEGRQYDLSADTFQLAAMAGLYHRSGFFLEGSFRNRNFRSVRWDLPSGVEAVPVGWPRSVDLSALMVSVGYQFGRLLE